MAVHGGSQHYVQIQGKAFLFFFFIHLGFYVQWEKLNTLTHPMVDSKAYANDLVDMIISIIEWDVMVQNSNKMWFW